MVLHKYLHFTLVADTDKGRGDEGIFDGRVQLAHNTSHVRIDVRGEGPSQLIQPVHTGDAQVVGVPALLKVDCTSDVIEEQHLPIGKRGTVDGGIGGFTLADEQSGWDTVGYDQ